MRPSSSLRTSLLLLLSLLLCLPVMGQVRQISSAPFTGGVLKSALLLPDGSVTAPSLGFAGDADGTGSGWFRSGTNDVYAAINGLPHTRYVQGQMIMAPGNVLGWGGSSTASTIGTGDLILARDAANTLAQRNGTNAQTFRIYNTYTDASNYERLSFGWVSNTFVIAGEGAGTGVERKIRIGGWVFQSSADRPLAPNADNAYDIGTSITRLRSVYMGSGLYLSAQTAPDAPASGAVLYIDTADSDLKIKYSDGTVVVIGNKP